MDEYKDSQFDIVYFAANSVDTDTFQPADRADHLVEVINKCRLHNSTEHIRFEFSEPWAKFISRQLVIENNITFQETPISNDYMFSMQVEHHSTRCKVDASAIYCVTERACSVSRSLTPSRALIRLKVDTNVFQFLKHNGHPVHKPIYYVSASLLPILHGGTMEEKKDALAICKKIGINKGQILLLKIKSFFKGK